MVNTIKTLIIIFDYKLKINEIPLFRGAIIDSTQNDNNLFHNHLDDSKYRYAYPLIQYKRIGGKLTDQLPLKQGLRLATKNAQKKPFSEPHVSTI